MSDLVQMLRDKQTEGESDATFAARLGVNRETWRLIRTGQIKPGPRTLRGVMAAFPDLQGIAMAFFLTPDATKRATGASTLTEREPAEVPA